MKISFEGTLGEIHAEMRTMLPQLDTSHPFPNTRDEELEKHIRLVFFKDRRKISAIKFVRAMRGGTLRDAKCFVDRVWPVS